MSEEQKRRGRKPLPPEELKARKNISVDADIQELLGSLQDELEEEFGFRPTLSQAIKYVVRKFRQEG